MTHSSSGAEESLALDEETTISGPVTPPRHRRPIMYTRGSRPRFTGRDHDEDNDDDQSSRADVPVLLPATQTDTTARDTGRLPTSKASQQRQAFSSPSQSVAPGAPQTKTNSEAPGGNSVTERIPKTDVEILASALAIVRAHLSSLDNAIKANITEQVNILALSQHPTTPPVTAADAYSLPDFKAGDAGTPGAVLRTAQVCCVVERGLEALIEVLGLGEGKENLMGVCLDQGNRVGEEMGSAVQGVRRVVGYEEDRPA
ncbi:hypothetical protein QTJ16_004508 [Diplocarpon rosae]|uniref:Uncharacterized protein n=1 Tax=Diplocarpon rosae TaxID=946125 RepID=A0AAD9SZ34_9HELO|nr:hypothetical protein QTJ16_004508 [Diplocarpon rosae]